MIVQTTSIALWLIAFILSFTFLPLHHNEMITGMLALLSIVSLISVYSGLNIGQWQLPKHKSFIVLGLFWVLTLASVFWSQIQWHSIQAFLTFSSLPISLLFLYGASEVARNRIVKTIIIILSVFAVFAIYQYYLLPHMLYEGRVKWPLRNPNSLGAVFSMGTFLAMGLFLKERSKFALMCIALLFIGLILTGSRGAFGAFIIGAIIFGAVLKPKICWKRTGAFIVALGLAAVAITFSGLRPDNMAIVSSVTSVTGESSMLWSRGEIWASTWQLIQGNMLLGTGIGTFGQFYEQYRAPTEHSAGLMAHNDPLHFWAEMGIGAIILFYAFVIAFCVQTVKGFKTCKDTIKRTDIIVCFCALGAMIGHSHVSFNLHILPILFMSGLCMAIWGHAVGVSPYIFKRSKFLSVNIASPLLSGIWLSCVFIIVAVAVSNYHVKKAKQSDYNVSLNEFVYHVNEANKWSLGLNYQPYVLVAPIKILMLESDINILMRSDKKARIKEIEDMLTLAQTLNPMTSGVPANQALLAQLLTEDAPEYGDIDKHLEEAIRLKPRNFSSRMWLVDRHNARGDIQKAIDIMEPSMVWCRRDKYAYECYSKMATLLLENGEIKRSQEMLQRAHNIRKKSKI